MRPHDFTLTRVDPDEEWGPVIGSCPVCGSKTFANRGKAYDWHGERTSAMPMVMAASMCRGMAFARRATAG
jgi:hypothetical protein